MLLNGFTCYTPPIFFPPKLSYQLDFRSALVALLKGRAMIFQMNVNVQKISILLV